MAPARHPSLLGGGTGKRPQATPSSRLCFECFECAALIFLNLSPDFRDKGDPTLRAEMSLLLGPAVGPPATSSWMTSCGPSSHPALLFLQLHGEGNVGGRKLGLPFT